MTAFAGLSRTGTMRPSMLVGKTSIVTPAPCLRTLHSQHGLRPRRVSSLRPRRTCAASSESQDSSDLAGGAKEGDTPIQTLVIEVPVPQQGPSASVNEEQPVSPEQVSPLSANQEQPQSNGNGIGSAIGPQDAVSAEGSKFGVASEEAASAGVTDSVQQQDTASATVSEAVEQLDSVLAAIVDDVQQQDAASAAASDAVKPQDTASAAVSDPVPELDAVIAAVADTVQPEAKVAAAVANTVQQEAAVAAAVSDAVKPQDIASAAVPDAAAQQNSVPAAPSNGGPQQGSVAPVIPHTVQRQQTASAELKEKPRPYKQKSLQAQVIGEFRSACAAVKNVDFTEIIPVYMKRVEEILEAAQDIECRHIVSVIYGTGQIFETAGYSRSSRKPSLTPELCQFLHKNLKRLRTVLPGATTQHVSNLFLAFEQMQYNPKFAAPDVVDKLVEDYMKDIGSSTVQSYTNILSACAVLRLNPCEGRLLDTMALRIDADFASKMTISALVKTVHTWAKLPRNKAVSAALTHLCNASLVKLQEDPDPRLRSFHVSNFAWSLARLKHLPSLQLSAAMTRRLVEFCLNIPQPPQSISNYMFACAVHRVTLAEEDVNVLLGNLFAKKPLKQQEVANTSWSLAAMGILTFSRFTELLDSMQQVSIGRGLHQIGLNQLHLALKWLQPKSDADQQQQEEWRQLQARIQAYGPPISRKSGFQNVQQLKTVLTELEVQFKMQVEINEAYWVDAVVVPQRTGAPPLLLSQSYDYFINQSDRATGKNTFREELLARAGKVVHIPFSVAIGPPEYLKVHLDSAMGSNWDAYRVEPAVAPQLDPTRL